MRSIPSKGVSVIICTYNGEKQLPITLDHLFKQKELSGINWEIIIIDNNSSDGTSLLIDGILRANEMHNLKTFFQPIPGKLAALKMAVSSAAYESLLICDDDNWLDEHYLANAYHFMEEHPEVGVLGGKGAPVDPSSLPKWIVPHLHNYAAAEQWHETADITDTIGSVYGAGMVIRKEIYTSVFQQSWPLYLSALRKGKILLSGEDTEICYIATLFGYRIYYNSDLKFQHNFPTAKINQRYLLNLVYFFGFGGASLLPYTQQKEKNNKSIIKIFFLETYRLLRYDCLNYIQQPNLTHKKKLYYRYGFIKGIFVNYKQIKSLKNYLKNYLTSAGSSHHI
jgi:glycosyltransferase involved in cell wall biosynthesis